jgi:hypothetical protein
VDYEIESIEKIKYIEELHQNNVQNMETGMVYFVFSISSILYRYVCRMSMSVSYVVCRMPYAICHMAYVVCRMSYDL